MTSPPGVYRALVVGIKEPLAAVFLDFILRLALLAGAQRVDFLPVSHAHG
jgi:hypothetical protein